MRWLVSAFMAAAVLCSCGTRDTEVPRPTAYPRIELCDSVFEPVPGFPVRFEKNVRARLQTVDGSGGNWVNLRYDSYGATVFLTLVRLSRHDSAAVVRSRLERMAMNLQGTVAEEDEFYSRGGDFRVYVVSEPGWTPTPIQFIACGGGFMLSGSAGFDRECVNPDSVAPVLSSLKRDIYHGLMGL